MPARCSQDGKFSRCSRPCRAFILVGQAKAAAIALYARTTRSHDPNYGERSGKIGNPFG